MPWPDVKAARQVIDQVRAEAGFFTYDDDGRRVIDQVRADALAHFAERELVGKVLRTPDDWAAIEDMHVLDPDGWRRDGKDWFEPITHEDFLARVMQSTIVVPRGAW